MASGPENPGALARPGVGCCLYAAGTPSTDERRLLKLISQSKEPVAPSSFFHTIHPPTFDSSALEDDPGREKWSERQISLYGAMLRLHDLNLIRVVVPEDGANPDLMEATDQGRAVLS
ncbi:hypothetical protein [Streptomyces sp. NPDC016626]|uniref:hypothetical protein n=1 Tax=Streptomyces sp. NPDC016626 TaxID=3364968 RepID=UPI0036F80FD4